MKFQLSSLSALVRRLEIRLTIFAGPLIFSFFAALLEIVTAILLTQILTLVVGTPTGQSLSELDAVANYLLAQGLDRPKAVGVTGILIILAVTLKVVFFRLASIRVTQSAHDLAHRLRTLLFERSTSSGPGVLEAVGHRDLNHLLLVFPTEVALEIRPFHAFFYQSMLLLLYTLLLVAVSLKLAFAAVIIFFFYQRIVVKFASKIHVTGETARESAEELGSFVQRLNNCYSLSRTYDSEQRDSRHFAEASKRQAHLSADYDNACSAITPLFEFVSILACGLLAMLAVSLVDVSLAHFSIFVLVVRRAAASLSYIKEFQVRIKALQMTSSKFIRVLDLFDSYRIESGTKEFEGLSKEIECRNLTFSYRSDRPVLRNISLKIQKGETFALIGASGCGKTTLVRLLARYRDCEPGSIFFDGIDIREYSLQSVYRKIAYISQDSGEVFRGTVRENILYGLAESVSESTLVEACELVGFSDFLSRCPFGFETILDDRATTISGGERQRLALVRALLRNPSLLFLDEFTNGLDPVSAEKVEHSILASLPGTTKIVVTHDRTRLSLAHRIGVIVGGELVQVGTMENLLSEQGGPFAEFWWNENKRAARS